MKKTYVKPEIIFENFSLSNHIAGDCEVDTDLQSRGSCGYKLLGGSVVFASSETGCDYTSGVEKVENDYTYNNICYHVPTDTKTLFNS